MSTTKDRFPCSGIEGCRLRYLKFKCIDEPSTLEFYTTLGMTLDGRCSFGRSHSAFRLAFRTANVEFNENSVALIFETPNKAPDGSPDGQRSSGRPPSLRGSGSGPSGGNGNGSGNILGAYPTPLPPIAGNAATSPGGTATPGSTGSPGGSRPRRMSRSRAGGMVSAQSRSGAAASGTATTAPNGHDQGNDNNGANKPVLFDRTCPRDYLVVYVHFLPRIIKRLHSKGFRAILAFTTVPTDAAISYAIYLDPNGIELRLVEMPDVYLNEVASKSPWFARVGYYLTHVPSADDARHFLESLFSKQRRTPAMVRALQTGGGIMGGGPSSSSSSGGGSGNAMSFQMSAGAGSLSAPGGSSKKTTAADRFYQRDGVRLVDQEDIATGLQQTRYVWLGQVARDKMGTLCVCERAGVGDRGAAGALAAAAAATSIAAHAAAKNDGNGGNSRGFGSNGSSEQPQAAATVAVVTAAAIAAEMAGGMGAN
ncbi:hypothetical protein BC828DRAFT_246612 [Blastocladiella britannica]|nr:hypothetical protein BC828DRAFT_246612 [Blastocladiella britannica]